MNTLFFIGFVFFLTGYLGLGAVDKTNPKLSKREIVLAIMLFIGMVCLTVSITLFIVN